MSPAIPMERSFFSAHAHMEEEEKTTTAMKPVQLDSALIEYFPSKSSDLPSALPSEEDSMLAQQSRHEQPFLPHGGHDAGSLLRSSPHPRGRAQPVRRPQAPRQPFQHPRAPATIEFSNKYAALEDSDGDGPEETHHELNPHLMERFTSSRPLQSVHHLSQADVRILPNPGYAEEIQRYFNESKTTRADAGWASRPEVPTPEEIMSAQSCPDLKPNIPQGSFADKEEYLKTHYELMREDATRPLREAVEKVRDRPHAMEGDLGGAIGLYDKVHVVGITFAIRGIAVRMAFSLARIGKRIHWKQSKRLMSGSLVALSPLGDMFRSSCVLATVAARPLNLVDQDPPEIDLFFSGPEAIQLDPSISWVMVEHRGAYYEAARHTLRALQKLRTEPFPLSEHLVDVETTVDPPQYLLRQPQLDLSAVVTLENTDKEVYHTDVLQDWPSHSNMNLDKSQAAALKRIITKRLANVQGPPGTGKTHVSVEALKVMISNLKPGDPPIIVTCQTNHALDQLLKHIANFEKSFVRLGGRSKDTDIIKKRTLFEVRSQTQIPACNKVSIIKSMRALTDHMKGIVEPLELGDGPLDHNILKGMGLLTAEQCVSLEHGDDDWVGGTSDDKSAGTPIERWLGNMLIPADRNIEPDTFGFEYEEADFAFEQLKEQEAENVAADDDELEALKGVWVPIADNFTGKRSGVYTDEKIRAELQKYSDMTRMPIKLRGPVYCYLQSQAKAKITKRFREKAVQYQALVEKRQLKTWEENIWVLKDQKVIGMTTTGFSKYRAMISVLKPKIVVVEEAAETLEAPVIATCVPSLEHLVLVGDHKQLRPHCQLMELEDEPYYLNLSLFERMVLNGIEFSSLKRQRRMIPEIRRLLKPIYGNMITDHPHVKDPAVRPPIPGMGGCNSFFFTHDWPEERDATMSCFNRNEAAMISGFCKYLIYQGILGSQITVLTFYNGQRKRLREALGTNTHLRGSGINICTVDSYQGEENEVIILSLTRSNSDRKIGFLSVDNRVCVALSRAKCGLYIFGNGELLCSESETWAAVISIMHGKSNKKEQVTQGPPSRLGYHLPVTCSNHQRILFMQQPEDWDLIVGGCLQKCTEKLPCGHTCSLTCHPKGHGDDFEVECRQQCQRQLPCGHPCSAPCLDVCRCNICIDRTGKVGLHRRVNHNSGQIEPPRQQAPPDHTSHWHHYAAGGVKEADRRLAKERSAQAADARRARLDGENSEHLFGVTSSSGNSANRLPSRRETTRNGRVSYTEPFNPRMVDYGRQVPESLLD